jgi:anhydro-N-acetylmuramic acid kinase
MVHWLQRLAALYERPAHVVGLLSGTSADAIDAAVCCLAPPHAYDDHNTPRVQLLHLKSYPHDPHVHQWIARAEALGARHLAEMHVRVGQRFAQACADAISSSGRDRIDLIGSHGQTLYHHSQIPGAARCTLQVGDADHIAELTGIPVVSDFRARDIAAGGEGAPLTPIADSVLFRPFGPYGRRAVLNIGGIANLTILDENPERILGFDTGPGNALLDRLTRRLTTGQLSCDVDGRLAAAGVVNQDLLKQLLENDAFLRRSPPKSTGFEMYGDAFLEDVIHRNGKADADLLATLSELTAQAVGLAIAKHIAPEQQPDEIVVAGGGARNADLMRRLALGVQPRIVTRSDTLGVPVEAREAMAFAILAHRTVLGLPSSWPGITGVRHPVVLGKLSFPAIKPA